MSNGLAQVCGDMQTTRAGLPRQAEMRFSGERPCINSRRKGQIGFFGSEGGILDERGPPAISERLSRPTPRQTGPSPPARLLTAPPPKAHPARSSP
jgi:hypothetical protein